MNELYLMTYWGIAIVLATMLVQWFFAAASKAKQPGAIPGKIAGELSHDSFVFRSNRTFQNSLENLATFLGSAVLAILVAANPLWTGIATLTYAFARIIHMLLYYKIATEKNPSPRTWFFLIAWLANVTLIALVFIKLLTI